VSAGADFPEKRLFGIDAPAPDESKKRSLAFQWASQWRRFDHVHQLFPRE